MDDFLSARQAAARIGVTYSRFMGWVYAGKVKFERKGYYYYVHKDEVERLRTSVAA